jgi:HEAT repeat protein
MDTKESVLASLHSGDLRRRESAVASICAGDVSDADYVQPLVRVAMDTTDPRLASMVVQALGRMGSAAALPFLLERLELFGNHSHSHTILKAISQIGITSDEVIEFLTRQKARIYNHHVRGQLRRTLAELEAKRSGGAAGGG